MKTHLLIPLLAGLVCTCAFADKGGANSPAQSNDNPGTPPTATSNTISDTGNSGIINQGGTINAGTIINGGSSRVKVVINNSPVTIQASPSRSAGSASGQSAEVSLDALKQGVQLTELGNMRAVFTFAKGAEQAETRVTEAFSNAGFRVFPSPVAVEGRIEPAALQKIGIERYCDMVVFTRLSAEEKPALGSLRRFEAEATVQVYNPMSEELMVSTTVRSSDEARTQKKSLAHPDAGEARRLAVNLALDSAIKETITKTVEKAHQMFVFEAQLKGVLDAQHLLDILNYTAKLAGVHHVRQISYDKQTMLAVIEIIASPQTETYWRAYLNNLPKHEILLQKGKEPVVRLNPELRKKHGIDFEKLNK